MFTRPSERDWGESMAICDPRYDDEEEALFKAKSDE